MGGEGEVEGELVAGELSGGHRTAHVQGLLRAAGFELFGTGGQRGVEVEGIGKVELALEISGAVEGDPVMVERHMPGPRPPSPRSVGPGRA